jgi:hypothetical protein
MAPFFLSEDSKGGIFAGVCDPHHISRAGSVPRFKIGRASNSKSNSQQPLPPGPLMMLGNLMPFCQPNRRAVIAALGGAAAWPVVARAQETDRMRHVGVLMSSGIDERMNGDPCRPPISDLLPGRTIAIRIQAGPQEYWNEVISSHRSPSSLRIVN